MKTSKILSKALAMILCVVMVLQMMPLGVFADETDESTPEVFSEVPEDSEDTEDSEIEVYSRGSEDDPVEATYTVEHHLQTEDGYAIDEVATETKTGEVGAATAAAAKTYEGYTAKEIAQGTIAADGSTVVVICYDKSVPEIVEASYSVQHHFQTEDGYAIDEAATETKTGEIGAATAAEAKTYEGYTAKEFAQGTVAADGTTVVAIYYDIVVSAPTTAEYKVEHYLQTEDGYAIDEAATETKTGEIGAATAAEAKTYEGYTAKEFAQGTIAAEGTTVVAIYYDIVVPAPTAAEYKVEHYLQTEDGYAIDEAATEVKTGEVGAETAAEAKTYEGYTAEAFAQAVIAEDGSAVVKVYYNKNVDEAEGNPEVDAMSDEELVEYVGALSDDELAAFVTSLSPEQYQRVASLLGIETYEEDEQIITYKTIESTLAPGITQSINSGYAADGNLINYYVAVADINQKDVGVHVSYKDAQCTTAGLAQMTKQVEALETLHGNPDDVENYIPYYAIVAGINGDGYNTSTGKPSGAHVTNGVSGFGISKAANTPWFAIFEDGTALCGSDNTDWDAAVAAHGAAVEAIGGFQLVRKNGVDYAPGSAEAKSTYLSDGRYPRSFVGVTADNKVVIMAMDGNGSGGSVGTNYAESLELMDEAGCTYILCLDGGGSATFVSRPEGGGEIKVTNKPSDGSPRAVSNGLVFYTTTPPSDIFARATLTAEHTYVTPGSTVTISSAGVSPAGTAAEIPAEAVMKVDEAYGTIENGAFVSNGTAGDVVVWMEYNGEKVGETTIHVVIPEKIEFSKATISVPYEKTETLEIVATYGLNEVVLKDGDIKFSLSDEAAGTIEGISFTACKADTGLTGATITATFAGDETITCTAALNFGKASMVIADFEDGTANGFAISVANEGNQDYDMYVVTAENGKVHSGNGALAVELDFRNISDATPAAGSYTGNTVMNKTVPVSGQVDRVGMWMYIPELEEMTAITARFFLKGTETGKTFSHYIFLEGDLPLMDCDGWHYFEVDSSSLGENKTIAIALQVWITESPGNVNNGYNITDYKSHNSKFTLYIDDITTDYSSVVEDRENPVFDYVKVGYVGLSDAVALNGQTISQNEISVTAKASDDMTKDNATGIDAASAKAYIDGVPVGVYCSSDGLMTVEDVKLADGTHTFKFVICDKQGNSSYIERQLTVNSGSGMTTVSVVPDDSSADKLPIGSIYWMDIKTSDIEKIQSVTTVLNLNSVNTWELAHMETAYGFEASYYVDAVTNNATVTITRTGENTQSGEAVLAKLPIRTWESKLAQKDPTYTQAYMWEKKIVWPIDIKLEADLGRVTFADGTSGTFSMAPLAVDTELYAFKDTLAAAGKTGWHTHSAQTIDDKAATCTENGYTGRTWCDNCASPVVWGTTQKATGHTFAITDGVLKCNCGQTFTGIWIDGKEYVNGDTAADGWSGDSYYRDGVKLTGIQVIDGYYYDFGEDGVCAGQMKLTGLFYDESVSAYRYAKLGELQGGWVFIGDYWHFFDQTTMVAATGKYNKTGTTVEFEFDETGKTEGTWRTTADGTKFWYGPSCYQAKNVDQRYFVEIDGKTYNFNKAGYLTTGIHALYDDWASTQRGEMNVWEFDENGVLIRQITDKGLIDNKRGGMYLVEEDGFVHGGNAHLASYNGDIYFVCHSGKLKQNGSQVITSANSNGHLDSGTYYFGDDCKLYNGIKWNDDTQVYNYYKGGLLQKDTGLIQYEGDYYFVCYSGKLKQNASQNITAANSNGLLDSGTYYFGEDCKLVSETGITWNETEQAYYYCKDGNIGSGIYNSELVEIDGAIYLVKWSGKVAANETREITSANSNGLLDPGTYYFGDDCKLYNGIKWNDDTQVYNYYKGGLLQKNTGLIQYEDDYYFVCHSGKLKQDGSQEITTENSNGLLDPGTYYFGGDCKAVFDTGIVWNETEQAYYYCKDGKICAGVYNNKLVEINDAIYFVKWSGKVAANETRKINILNSNGLLPSGSYYFGEGGKLFTGVKEDADGILYYYKGGKLGNTIYNSELAEINGAIYLVKHSGKVAANEIREITSEKANGLLESGTYYFGEDGKLFTTGVIADSNGILYYYKDGKLGNGLYYSELVEINGAIYLIKHSGKVAVDETREITAEKANGLIKAGTYYFDKDGKLTK